MTQRKTTSYFVAEDLKNKNWLEIINEARDDFIHKYLEELNQQKPPSKLIINVILTYGNNSKTGD